MPRRLCNGQLAEMIRPMAIQEPAILADYLEDRLPDSLADKKDTINAVRENRVNVELSMCFSTMRFLYFTRLGSFRMATDRQGPVPLKLNTLSKQTLRARWASVPVSGTGLLSVEPRSMRGILPHGVQPIYIDSVPDMHQKPKSGGLYFEGMSGCQWRFRSVADSPSNQLNASLFALVWLIYGWSWRRHPAVGQFLDLIE